jgi:hypothetical protein
MASTSPSVDRHGVGAQASVDSKTSSNHAEARHNKDISRDNEKDALQSDEDALDHEHEPPVCIYSIQFSYISNKNPR